MSRFCISPGCVASGNRARALVLVALVSSLVLIASTSAQADSCRGPVSGKVATQQFDFTYESWMKPSPQTKAYRFERCVQNDGAKELWINWESTGLKGVAKPHDISYKFFDEVSDDKVEKPKSLWYGPRPDEEKPTTVLRPDEADKDRLDRRLLHLAQDGPVTLQQALDNPLDFARYLESNPDPEHPRSVTLYAGGRVAVPTTETAMQALKSDATIQPTDFIAVRVWLADTLTLDEDGRLMSNISLHLNVDPKELSDILESGGRLPTIRFGTKDEEFAARLKLPEIVEPLKENSFVLADAAPSHLMFPVRRRPLMLDVRFNDGDAELLLPFGLMTVKGD